MYHTVRIHDLAPQILETDNSQRMSGNKQKGSRIFEHFWTSSINISSDYDKSRYYSNKDKYHQTYFEANGPHTHIINSGHAVFEAYLAAYNAHYDLVLSPDDIWLMMTIEPE
jgi:hypothetical protein